MTNKSNNLKLSLFFFSLAAVGVSIRQVDLEGNGLAFFYLIILFLLTFVPAIFLFIEHANPWLVTLTLTPVLLLSLDTFFLRLGVFNVYRYFENDWHPAINSAFLQKTALMVLWGNLMLWIGYLVPGAKHLGEDFRQHVQKWSTGEFRFSENRLWVLFFIGLAARFYMLQNSLGGYFSFDASTQANALAYIQYIALFENLTVLSLVVYFSVLINDQYRINVKSFYLMLAMELITVFLMGFKGQVIYRLIYLAIAYVYLKGKFPMKIAWASVALLLVVMPVNLLMRTQYSSGQGVIERGSASTIAMGTINALQEVSTNETEFTIASAPERFVRQSAQMQDFTMAVQYVDRTGQTLEGLDFKNFFFSFIPRAIWPSKPIAALGGWFNEHVYGFGSASAAAITVPGDLYLNFGWWGVPIGFLFFGMLLRIITKAVVDTQPNLRLVALIPFVIVGIGMPSSELGSHLAGLVRQIGFYAIVISVYLLPHYQETRWMRASKQLVSSVSPQTREQN